MTAMELTFLRNQADEEEGLGDAGIETFRDTPYVSTARECGQNSKDAGSKLPIYLSFDMFKVAPDEIPCLDQLQQTIDACLAKAKGKDDEKEIDFFESAKSTVSAEAVKVFCISDANTRGLVGPAVAGTPFHSLVKSTGVSKKESDTSGGSFGIGKMAAYTLSTLQTVFYSTQYKDAETGANQFLAQGKSVLVSHVDGDGEPRAATGYWGAPGFQPLDNVEDVPEWLKRDEIGTSVYSLGFRDVADWRERMAFSLISNFFVAFEREEMEASVGVDIKINAHTIATYLEDKRIAEAAEGTGRLEELEFSRAAYECLMSKDSVDEVLEIESLGKIRVRVLVKAGMPKRVMFIRNGMVITDNLGSFGDRFARFAGFSDFIAMVEPCGKKGSTLLKQLENPSHNNLSAERLTDPNKAKKATVAMKQLAKQIRDVIKKHSLVDPEEEEAIDELAEFFADESDADKIADDSIEVDPEKLKYREIEEQQPRVKVTPSGQGDEGGAGGGGGDSGGSKGGTGGQEGRGTGGSGDRGHRKIVPLADIRNRLDRSDGESSRNVFMTPSESVEALLYFSATGMNAAERLNVAATSVGDIENGAIRMMLEKDDRLQVIVSFDQPYIGPIEVHAEEVVTE